MNRVLSIFEDENGTLSFIRMIGAVFALSFIVQWQKAIWIGGDMPGVEELVTMLATFGFKIIQKPFEKPK